MLLGMSISVLLEQTQDLAGLSPERTKKKQKPTEGITE